MTATGATAAAAVTRTGAAAATTTATSTAGREIGIGDYETRALEPLDVVNARTLEQWRTLVIDKHLDSAFDNPVRLRGRFLEPELIIDATVRRCDYSDAQVLAPGVLLVENLKQLGRCCIGGGCGCGLYVSETGNEQPAPTARPRDGTGRMKIGANQRRKANTITGGS